MLSWVNSSVCLVTVVRSNWPLRYLFRFNKFGFKFISGKGNELSHLFSHTCWQINSCQKQRFRFICGFFQTILKGLNWFTRKELNKWFHLSLCTFRSFSATKRQFCIIECFPKVELHEELRRASLTPNTENVFNFLRWKRPVQIQAEFAIKY